MISTNYTSPRMPGELEIRKNRLPQWRLAQAAYMVTWSIAADVMALSPNEKDVVVDSLRHFHGSRYKLYAYAVMDDHVHLVIRVKAAHDLSSLLQGWKSYTAHSINKLRARSGALWQKDSYTRIMRSEEELYEKIQYVLNNPLKEAGCSSDYKWYGWIAE